VSAGAIIPGGAQPAPPPGVKGAVPADARGPQAAGSGGTPAVPQPQVLLGQSAVPAGELFRQTAAALALPVDALSVTLLALARFFSLPPSHALIAALRKEVLASPSGGPPFTASSPQTPAEKAALQATSMAVAAAFDKGVALSSEALERYARFFDPAALVRDREGAEKDATAGGGGKGGDSRGREQAPKGDELKAIAEEEAEKDTLLDVLNSIPGKNGRYWVVFPFNITVRGIELRVFVRILKGGPFSAGGDEHVIVDTSGPKRQYRCFLKRNGGKLRADIRVYPELSPRALRSLSKSVKGFFGEGISLTGDSLEFEEFLVQNGEGVPSWAEGLSDEYLPSVNGNV